MMLTSRTCPGGIINAKPAAMALQLVLGRFCRVRCVQLTGACQIGLLPAHYPTALDRCHMAGFWMCCAHGAATDQPMSAVLRGTGHHRATVMFCGSCTVTWMVLRAPDLVHAFRRLCLSLSI